MTPCTAKLNGGPLFCSRQDPHDPEAVGGHVYYSTSGMAHHKHEDDGGDS